MGFLSSLFGISKMNADPDQQRLARMLIEAAEDSSKHVDLVNWIIRQPWRDPRRGHALRTQLRLRKYPLSQPPMPV
jgi:hypothetical protein